MSRRCTTAAWAHAQFYRVHICTEGGTLPHTNGYPICTHLLVHGASVWAYWCSVTLSWAHPLACPALPTGLTQSTPDWVVLSVLWNFESADSSRAESFLRDWQAEYVSAVTAEGVLRVHNTCWQNGTARDAVGVASRGNWIIHYQ